MLSKQELNQIEEFAKDAKVNKKQLLKYITDNFLFKSQNTRSTDSYTVKLDNTVKSETANKGVRVWTKKDSSQNDRI